MAAGHKLICWIHKAGVMSSTKQAMPGYLEDLLLREGLAKEVTFRLGPGAGGRANKEKADGLPPSVSLSLGGGRVCHAQSTARVKVPRQGRTWCV